MNIIILAGKLRPRKMVRAYFWGIISAFLLFFGGGAGAAVISQVFCNGVWSPPVINGVVDCLNAQGTAHLGSADSTGSSAGLDNFYNTINAKYNSAAARPEGYTGADGLTFYSYTTPTWNVNKVNTSLTLNGGVQFSDPNIAQDSITLDLIGWLGGPQLQIIKKITTADYNTAKQNGLLDQNGFLDFSVTVTGVQLVDPTADEWLTINSIGRVIYQNDDTFVGSAPEPATLALFALGLPALLVIRRRRMMSAADFIGLV